MSMNQSWCTLEEAAEKFGIEQGLILQWVDEGLVRSESEQNNVVRVHCDDLELKVNAWTHGG
jgi:hypothetical protein